MTKNTHSAIEPSAIKLLGDPILRSVAEPVKSFDEPEFALDQQRLHATLMDFRAKKNFGPSQVSCEASPF